MAKKKTAPAPKRTNPAASFEEIGSGITKRRVLTFTGLTLPEEIAVRRSLSTPLPDTLDFSVKIAARVLDKHGIAYRPKGDYRTEDGRVRGLLGYVKAKGHRAYESPVWYAASIFQFWFLMRDSIAEGKAESAADFGFDIGRLYAEANLKFEWERDALTGNKYRTAQRDRGRKGAAVKAAKASSLHEEIKARAATMKGKKRSKAEILEQKFPLSADRIRKII